ncbi:MAG: AmmeMemoRadiSam system protein B [Acidobacteria bacterium]|jgi:AmmeMemoRadiSam system protein B|nr:AmmeMemoRadiSam system protein B [Acidobacteriota bacterium]
MSVGHRVRPPAVAGTFYPADPTALAALVDDLVADALPPGAPVPHQPKALIVPHAGYVYSGPVAASAFARLWPFRRHITRVVLAGPAHRVWLDGLALPGADRLDTPLGAVRAIEAGPASVSTNPRAHAEEHSLEVQLPFVQRVLGDVEVVPLVVGDTTGEAVAHVLDALWGDHATLILVSSDLSHYLDWHEARRRDAQAATQIEALGPPLTHEQACGATAINGLLLVAQHRRLRVERLDLRNSGDTAGPRDRVVGYGAFAFHEGGASA